MVFGIKLFVLIGKTDKMSIIRFVVVIILFVSCVGNDNEKEKLVTNKNNYFDKEQITIHFLESKNCLSMNDSAKWYLYNIYCDDTLPSSFCKSQTPIYLSYLPLRAISAGYSYDSSTIDIVYSFIYNDSMKIQHLMTKYDYIVEGVSVNINDKRIVGFIRGHGGHFQVQDSNNRFLNPLQPAVISFARENKQKLNSWYKTALENHGVKL